MSDSSQIAPAADSPTTNWSRPKSPLPPHRLAKLANALGVSTPNPAFRGSTVQVSYGRSSSHSASSPSLLEAWRSQTPPVPTPFSPGPHSASPTSSRYLLHVIPPLIIPHDSDSSNDSDTSLAPPSSGYHRQFRRGTLVTLQPTLQSQLAVIAKEYALPSTTGLVLYLVSSSAPAQGSIDVDSDGEPGPRLSDEIWKHLWVRVSRAEREESISIISRSPTPGGLVTASSSFGPRTSSPDPVSGLRPFRTAAPGPQLPPFMPPPSTPSSVSDFRSHSKSSTMSSEPETPGTSLSSHPEEDNNKESVSLAENMALPGLSSPSVIPILAKVEFDIDRRKAVWFDPWVRSRKMNQAKRDGSAVKSSFPSSSAAKPPSPSSKEEDGEGEGEGEKVVDDVRKPPLPLALVDGEESAGYTRLKNSDSSSSLSSSSEYDNDDDDDDDNDDDDNENDVNHAGNNHDNDDTSDDMQHNDDDDGGNATARQTLVTPGKNPIDPLEDVFGTDADAWADIHADANSRLSSLGTAPIQALPNPHIVNLALSAADLSAERFASEEEGENGGEAGDEAEEEKDDRHNKAEEEVEEVLEIMEKLGQKPKLSVNIPEQSSPPHKRKSTPVTAGTIKRHVPPPLSIPPMPDGLTAALEVSPLSDGAAPPTSAHSGTRLPYLAEDGRTPSSENMNPVDEQDLQKISEADLTIEFRPSPDEVKRGGGIYDDLDLGLAEYDENDPYDRRKSQYIMKAQLDEIEKHLAQFSPRVTNTELSMEQEQDSSYVSDGMLAPRPASNVAKNDIVFPSTPKTPVDGSQWPAVPYSALVRDGDSSSSPSSSPPRKISAPSPPRLALNGVSTSAPPAFQPSSRVSADVASAETQYRMRHQQEQDGMYGLDVPSTGSPTLPLSPDPFSRMSTSSMDSTTFQAQRMSGPFRDEPSRRQGSAPMDPISETGGMEEEGEEMGRFSRVISPTSRFSTDSITMEEPPPPTAKSSKSGGGIMGMRSIKKLWRKSNKSSVSSTLAPPPPPSVASSSSEYAASSRTPSPSGSSMGPPSMRSQQYMQPSRSEGSELYFDQETPYPIRRSQSSSKSSVNSSPPPSSSRPSLSTAPTPVPSRPASPSSDKEKGGNSVRKSILKSWKSASGSLKASSSSSSSSNGQADSVDAGRSSIDRSAMPPPDQQQPRSRRGSLAGLGRSGGGSKNSVVLAMADIPPSPRIPDQFVNNHEPLAAARARSSSLLSGMVNSGGAVGRRRPTHVGARPSISSYPSSQYTTSDADARVSMASSSRSRDSSDTRPSFDTSQFEMVTPPRMMTASLSYPVGDDSITTSMGDH